MSTFRLEPGPSDFKSRVEEQVAQLSSAILLAGDPDILESPPPPQNSHWHASFVFRVNLTEHNTNFTDVSLNELKQVKQGCSQRRVNALPKFWIGSSLKSNFVSTIQ